MRIFTIVLTATVLFFSGCTLSIIQTDTHGVSSDVVDDTNETEADADVDVPVSAIKYDAII
jgi:hypothetical protein